MKTTADSAHAKPSWLPQSRTVQLVIAVGVLFWSGFFTLEFLIRGIFTWPQTSRVVTLTLACIILGYEFVYKEAKTRGQRVHGFSPLKVVCYSCLIPYLIGGMVLLALLNWR